MIDLVGKIVACHESLAGSQIPYAFGGALALAWCTHRARGTIDIDLNLFVDVTQAEAVFDALPDGIRRSDKDLTVIRRDTQIRLWWDETPIDLFLNSTPFHTTVATRVRFEQFSGALVPFLSCGDLAVFKAFYDRTKDWADIEEMQRAGTLPLTYVLGVIVEYLGGDDGRVERLRSIRSIDIE